MSHAVANGYSLQTLSDAAIVQSNVSVVGSVFNCTFVRNNKINPKNVDLLNFYLLVAWGSCRYLYIYLLFVLCCLLLFVTLKINE